MKDMKTILCYGDSNTYGYEPVTGVRYPEEIRWPCRLKKLLEEEAPGENWRVVEEGCNGRTCSVTPPDEEWKDGRPYLKACLNSHKPIDWVVLMLGSNDMKAMFKASPEQIAAGIRGMLQTIAEFLDEKQGYVPNVLLISPPLVGEGIGSSVFNDRFDSGAIEKSTKLAALYEAEAEAFAKAGAQAGSKWRCVFLNAAEIVEPSEADSLHLMPEAHEALARAVTEVLRDWTGGLL